MWNNWNTNQQQRDRNCVEVADNGSWFEYRFDVDQGLGGIGRYGAEKDITPSWMGRKVSDIPSPFEFKFKITKDDYGSYVNGAWIGLYGWSTPEGEPWHKGYEVYIVQDWWGADPGRTDVWGGTMVDQVGYVVNGARYFCRVSVTQAGATQLVSYREFPKRTGPNNTVLVEDIRPHYDYWRDYAIHSPSVAPEAVGDEVRFSNSDVSLFVACEAMANWASTGKVRFTNISIPDFASDAILPADPIRITSQAGATFVHSISTTPWQNNTVEFQSQPTYPQQKWNLVPVASGEPYYNIVNVSNQLALHGNSSNERVYEVPHNNAKDRQWQLIPLGNDEYQIINRKSGKALTAYGVNFGALYTRTPDGSGRQIWSFVD